MFERFTEQARQVIILAREEAGRFRHDFVGTEHMLLGLLRQGEGRTAVVLYRMGLRLETVKAEVERALAGFPKALTFGEVFPFTPQAKRVMELSIEEALQLAQTAKEAAPDDPNVSDTLGWILYKRGVYQRALSLLEESATKIPDNPTVQYHLGMAYSKVGNKDAARKALAKATSSKHEFTDLAAAKRALAELN